MSTNYYAIRKIDSELETKLISLIKSGDVEAVRELLPERVHIGKKSAGWKYIFNHNDWRLFSKTRESINDYLSLCNLFDEYKEPITLEEFWKIAEPKSDECDAAEYLDNWDKYSLNPLTGKIMPKPSYTAKDIEEYHDNLLFSTVSEFC